MRCIWLFTLELCTHSSSLFCGPRGRHGRAAPSRRSARPARRPRPGRPARPAPGWWFSGRGLLRRGLPGRCRGLLGGLGRRLDPLGAQAGQRLVALELVAGVDQRPAGRTGDPDTDHEPPQALAALGQGHVVESPATRVTWVMSRRLDRSSTASTASWMSAPFLVPGRREQLDQVDRAVDERLLVGGVRGHRPVGVRPGHRDDPERRGVVDDRAEVHLGLRELHVDRVGRGRVGADGGGPRPCARRCRRGGCRSGR